MRVELRLGLRVVVPWIDAQSAEQRDAGFEAPVGATAEEAHVGGLVADQQVDPAVTVPVDGDRVGLVADPERAA